LVLVSHCNSNERNNQGQAARAAASALAEPIETGERYKARVVSSNNSSTENRRGMIFISNA
jgi:hypothetical protein